jgi:two-component system, OmpR family, response regulator
VPRILVVDDNAVIRMLLRVALEGEGYEVIEAADGAEGLQRYQAAPTDLVITDLQMPGMDGLELLQALRRMVPAPALMAISGDREALAQARRFTPHTFAKPLPLAHVLAVVRTLAQRH